MSIHSVNSEGRSRAVRLRPECGRVLVDVASEGHFTDYLTCLRLKPEDARQIAAKLLKLAHALQMEDAPKHTYAVFHRLVQASKKLSLVTYEELGKSAGLPPIGLSPQLKFINLNICRAQGLPNLPALAVSKDTKLPSTGFLPEEWSGWSPKNPEFQVWWRAMVLLVYATDWTKVVPVGQPKSDEDRSQVTKPAWLSQDEYKDWLRRVPVT